MKIVKPEKPDFYESNCYYYIGSGYRGEEVTSQSPMAGEQSHFGYRGEVVTSGFRVRVR